MSWYNIGAFEKHGCSKSISFHVSNVHPRRLTWNLRMMVWKMIFLIQGCLLCSESKPWGHWSMWWWSTGTRGQRDWRCRWGVVIDRWHLGGYGIWVFHKQNLGLVKILRAIWVKLILGMLWYSRWWQLKYFFTPIWGRFPFWLIFFKCVGSTTN